MSSEGRTGISRRGRPQQRLAAWRAVFGALLHNPVRAARYALLTGRADRACRPGAPTGAQARVAVAGSRRGDGTPS